VPDCAKAHRSRGFCGKHYQQWRRGTLGDYVSPEGLVANGDGVLQVEPRHAGGAFVVSDDGGRLVVRVDGAEVAHTAR
jgi:hypothetical protein